jgi:hypothetical protein
MRNERQNTPVVALVSVGHTKGLNDPDFATLAFDTPLTFLHGTPVVLFLCSEVRAEDSFHRGVIGEGLRQIGRQVPPQRGIVMRRQSTIRRSSTSSAEFVRRDLDNRAIFALDDGRVVHDGQILSTNPSPLQSS